jgi:hypothetical protein
MKRPAIEIAAAAKTADTAEGHRSIVLCSATFRSATLRYSDLGTKEITIAVARGGEHESMKRGGEKI